MKNKNNTHLKKQLSNATPTELITIIQSEITNSISKIADMTLKFDAKIVQELKLVPLMYNNETMVNTTQIFFHVLQTIGILNGTINESNSTQCGLDVKDLIFKYTGIDTVTEINK